MLKRRSEASAFLINKDRLAGPGCRVAPDRIVSA